ncbi:MAG: hypothetical protein R3336_08995, partial [Phycisphaeraceae bacterium]|nr:hypothetical protein [Phycisphaeraceae bacterium]
MSTDTGLIEPHGGVLVNRFADDDATLKAEAAGLTAVPVSTADLATVARIADGTLSPLEGPMNEDVFNRVLDERILAANGKNLAWTIPLALPVTSELADQLSVNQTVALTSPDGEIIGTLDIESIFPWDKPRYLKSVYGTDRTDHPGADIVLENEDNADKTHLLGGKL